MGLGLREHCRFARNRRSFAVIDEPSSHGLGGPAPDFRPGAVASNPMPEPGVSEACAARGSSLFAPPAWYALRVKPRHEKAVAEALRAKGFEEFLPLCRERRRWSDRVKEIETPLFGGYTFCRFSAENWLAVLRAPGVVGVVKFGGALAEVDPEEIDALRAAVESGRMVRPCEFLSAGQRVRIVSGPLANVEGIFQRYSGSDQLVISVTILQRSVSVELEGETVIPIAAHRGYGAAASAG